VSPEPTSNISLSNLWGSSFGCCFHGCSVQRRWDQAACLSSFVTLASFLDFASSAFFTEIFWVSLRAGFGMVTLRKTLAFDALMLDVSTHV
jgi:hypothetical protein